jgi:putative tricarboxylic transport membrane protein
MGPGYFPTVLGGLLVLIGLVSVGRAVARAGDPLPPMRIKGLLTVTAATLGFGALVRGAGLVVALPLLVVVSAAASARFRWGPALALAAGLTLFCATVFLKGLGVPLPILGPWLGG